MTEPTIIHWTENGAPRAARWLSTRDEPAPRELRVVDDRLTATTLDDLMVVASGTEHPKLRPLLDLLPIAGGSGTLSDRFIDTGTRASAGWLRAKTGSLTGTNTLAGVVTDRSGRVLTFAFLSNGGGPTGRVALDNLAAVLRTCGCGG